MKNLKSILKLFVLALAALWIASCSNSFDVAEGPTGDAAQPAGHVRVLLGSAGVSKTILPQAWNEDTEKVLSYYLSGTGSLSIGQTQTFANKKLTFASITGTGEEIPLGPGTWSLTLRAYQLSGDETTPPDECKVLEATVDDINLTASGRTVTFDLKPIATSSTTATGSVEITCNVKPNTSLKYIVQDVCKRSAGGDLESIAGANYKKKDPVSETDAGANSLQVKYQKNVVAGSDYWYVVDFYNGDPDGTGPAKGELLGHYEEALKVDGGNKSIKTINLGDYLNSPANNPTTLEVTSTFESAGLDNLDDVSNLFLAKFKWDDNAGNESGYELKIFKDDASTATYTINGKSTITPGTGAGQVAAGSANDAGTKDPTMGKNETQISVWLATGHTYTASIRAYNRYDYDEASDTTTNITSVEGKTSAGGPFGMFTIAYTLGDANAFVKTGAGESDKVVKKIYVKGYQYSAIAGTLMKPYNSTATVYPYVTTTATGMQFINWIETDTNGTQTPDQMDAAEPVTSIPPSNITNLMLTGVWKSSVTATVTFPSYEALAAAKWLTSYKIGDDGTAQPISSNADMITITASEGDKIILTYDTDIVPTVKCTLKGGDQPGTATVSSGTITIDTGDLNNGIKNWNLNVYGTGSVTSNGVTQSATVSQPILIKLN